jgi:hypothetical protein
MSERWLSASDVGQGSEIRRGLARFTMKQEETDVPMIRSRMCFALLTLAAACSSTTNPDLFAGADGGAEDSSNIPAAKYGFDGAAGEDSSYAQDVRQQDGGSAEAGTCSTCARDWNQFPPVAQIDGVSELWIVSDIHGDYAAFTKLLSGAHVIVGIPASPQQVEWTAGAAVLVVVGDLIDKGPDAPDVVRLLAALQKSAASAGGRVVATMGNHEAEFLADPTNSKASGSDGIDPELNSIGLTPAQTAAGDDDIGQFVRNLPFAARIDNWFFAHGGKTGGKTIAQLSDDLRSGVDSSGFGAPVLSAADSLLEARLAKTGPQWWDATNDAQGLLTQWTRALGTTHLVMGHQPGAVGFADGTSRAADQMMQKYGGLLFLVDTGLSVGADNTGGALLHVTSVGGTNEAWREVLPNGSTKSL